MKYLKLLSISLLMFVFAIACQAGEDNRTVYDENTSDAYSETMDEGCLLYTSPSPRDATLSRMPSSA